MKTQLNLVIIDKSSRAKESIRCDIHDEISLTRFSDINVGWRVYNSMKQEGRKPTFMRGILAERYKGMDRKSIESKIISDLDKLKESLGNKVEFKLFRKEII